MSRNRAPENGPKRCSPAYAPEPVLPLPDARDTLGPYWLGVDWWQRVLVDHEWWLTYATVPADPPPTKPPAHLLDARPLNLFLSIKKQIEDHSVCPARRPNRCDPFPPQAWHAEPHSARCPFSKTRRRAGALTVGALS